MSGTREGGLKAKITTVERRGKDFYKIIGKKGGSVCGTLKGFAANPRLAREAGRKGGKISKRGKAKQCQRNMIESK